MNDLLNLALSAHGGMDRWNQLKTVDAHFLMDGITWEIKDVKGILTNFHYRIDLHQQRGKFPQFMKTGQQAGFQSDRVTIETTDGTVLKELLDPRASLEGQNLQKTWTDLQLIYLTGYALWSYLTTPFCFTMPGFKTEEIDPWQEDGDTWRRLRVTFPDYLARHAKEQIYYFDKTGLLKRHDYVTEAITKERTATHYSADYKEFAGIMIGTRRRIYILNPDGSHDPEPLLVSLDVEEVLFS